MFNKNLYDDYDLQLCEDLSIDIEAGEILTEFATVGRFQKYNMSVAVNPDNNRNLKDMEYFKVYNHIDPTKASKIARITFRSCEYVIHRNRGKKENWFLNRRERKQLIEILKSSSKKDIGYTVWQSLILNFNYETGLEYDDTKNNTSNHLIHKNYLPIDLKIPNYENYLFEVK
ncbi:MAG: hypothetical protein NC177_11815 [Ruminococcus flavefaciens]|nr:hypothetical protein [Ruminococcus flavefaciens]